MSKYRKALKNYSTGEGVTKTTTKIHQILLDFGAKGIGYGYDDNGFIESINFKILVDDKEQVVSVPLLVDNVAEVLKQQGKHRNHNHAYAVALANVRDWLDSQLAYLATKQVKFTQVFLPYMVDSTTGRTIFELVEEKKFILTDSNSK